MRLSGARFSTPLEITKIGIVIHNQQTNGFIHLPNAFSIGCGSSETTLCNGDTIA